MAKENPCDLSGPDAGSACVCGATDDRSAIRLRVRAKKESYRRYSFERNQEEAFATFFDLAQEYTSLNNLYLICVTVPQEFFGLESRLHVREPKSEQFTVVCTSDEGLIPEAERKGSPLRISTRPFETDDSWIFPIRGNEALVKVVPYLGQGDILGLFEISPKDRVSARSHFFLEKFSNRIGYNLHQKMLIQQNLRHLKFINQLVADIEHNVISPNLYYKLFLIRLRKQRQAYNLVQNGLKEFIGEVCERGEDSSRLCELYEVLDRANRALADEVQGFTKHYEHTSLFLETLLRRDHFEQGTYVLRRQSCNFRTEIIQPLLDRYIPMLEKKGIVLDNRLENVPDEQVTLFVDKGLISQVFDNFFSNALKYSHEVEDQLGHKIRLFSYTRQILANYFGEDVHGMKFSFFTTGRPLAQEEAEKIFDEGYRASDVGREKGSGHGLSFVKNVVEIHGGKVGCEPQPYGNVIYFVLPWKEELPAGQTAPPSGQ